MTKRNAERERLIDLFTQCENSPEKTCPHPKGESCKGCLYDLGATCNVAARLADFFLANGVVVPPCKIGDWVWYITGISGSLIGKARVEEICYNGDGFLFTVSNGHTYFQLEKEAFFTREAAEKALEERRNDEI